MAAIRRFEVMTVIASKAIQLNAQRKNGLPRRFAPRNGVAQISNSHDDSGVEPSLRVERSNPARRAKKVWIASLRSQ
jgi:hypothetical protein